MIEELKELFMHCVVYIEFNVKTYSMLEYWKNSNCKLCVRKLSKEYRGKFVISHISPKYAT